MTSKKEKIEVRVDEEWSRNMGIFIDGLIEDLFPEDEKAKIGKSSFLRHISEETRLFWKKSPYVCLNSKHFLFVNSEGHYFYLFSEKLRANSPLEAVPIKVSMKQEKIDFFLKKEFSRLTANHHKKLQKIWLFNKFWIVKGKEEIFTDDDDRGITTKSVKYEGSLREGSIFYRKGLVILENYASWGSKKTEEPHDYADFSVNIPTRNMEITVVVDDSAYQEGSNPIHYEFHNKELYRFRKASDIIPKKPERDYIYPSIRNLRGKYPKKKSKQKDERYSKAVRGINSSIKEINKRLEMHEKDHLKIEPLRNYYFYELEMPIMHTDLAICFHLVK